MNMEILSRADTMGGITRNCGWVAGAQGLGEYNKTNIIDMSNYVNNIIHLDTVDSTMKYGLADTRASGTYIRPDNPHENAHK